VTWSYTLVARKDLPHKDLADVVAFARANPDAITYASAGRGSGQHVAMAVTAQLAGVKLTHVAYRGAQAAYQDVLGDRVDLFLISLQRHARRSMPAACALWRFPPRSASPCTRRCRA
jgi:tripartite-type tricarboxylate transporter receptor subunit TctC